MLISSVQQDYDILQFEYYASADSPQDHMSLYNTTTASLK